MSRLEANRWQKTSNSKSLGTKSKTPLSLNTLIETIAKGRQMGTHFEHRSERHDPLARTSGT